MEATSRTRPVLGIDVGKRSHWGLPRDRRGEIALSAPVNRSATSTRLFSGVPGDALVVVDQVRNIGSLALKRAAVAGRTRAPTRTAMHGASRLFAGDAKTDEGRFRDRQDGDRHPRLAPARPAPGRRPRRGARRVAEGHLVAGATRDKNGLRSAPAGVLPCLRVARRPLRPALPADAVRDRRAVAGARRRECPWAR